VNNLRTIRFNNQKCYLLLTQFTDLRIISDYFHIQHYVIDFYSRNGVCLLRGTDLILYVIQINHQCLNS